MAKTNPKSTSEVHIPTEKEIKKRWLFFFSLATLLLVFVLFISNTVFTGKQFNVTNENLANLEQVMEDQRLNFQGNLEKFADFQERFRRGMNDRINNLEEADRAFGQTTAEMGRNLVEARNEIEYLQDLNRALAERDGQLQEYLDNLQANVIERKIISNDFLIKLHERQIEYLEQEKQDLIKEKVDGIQLTPLPEEPLLSGDEEESLIEVVEDALNEITEDEDYPEDEEE